MSQCQITNNQKYAWQDELLFEFIILKTGSKSTFLSVLKTQVGHLLYIDLFKISAKKYPCSFEIKLKLKNAKDKTFIGHQAAQGTDAGRLKNLVTNRI